MWSHKMHPIGRLEKCILRFPGYGQMEQDLAFPCKNIPFAFKKISALNKRLFCPEKRGRGSESPSVAVISTCFRGRAFTARSSFGKVDHCVNLPPHLIEGPTGSLPSQQPPARTAETRGWGPARGSAGLRTPLLSREGPLRIFWSHTAIPLTCFSLLPHGEAGRRNPHGQGQVRVKSCARRSLAVSGGYGQHRAGRPREQSKRQLTSDPDCDRRGVRRELPLSGKFT